MPEGPTILMLSEEAARFVGKTVKSATGYAAVDLSRLRGRKVLAVRTWGKHLLIGFAGFTVRVHLMLFGSYRIDERREGRNPTLSLAFAKGELNFYASSVKLLEGPLDDHYDWGGDVLSEDWDAAAARRKLKSQPERYACDALLDQDVFAGVGNIIKNEVLFRTRVHPLSRIGALPPRKLGALIKEARQYSFDFLAWRREGLLTRNLKVHKRKTCPLCSAPLEVALLGTARRRAFWCPNCQERYGDEPAPATARKRSRKITPTPPPRKRKPR